MILFPHMLAGALIGAKTENWGLIFILAIVSHYLLDLLPHWDYSKKEINQLSRKGLFYFLSEVAADLMIGILSIWLLFTPSASQWPYLLWGAFWSIFPDGLNFLNHLTNKRIKILVQQNEFHERIHWLFNPNKKTLLWTGFIIEGLTIMVLIFLILI